MNKLKEGVLNDAKKSGEDISNASNTNVTAGATAGTATPNHAYIYGVGDAAFLAISVCVFFCIYQEIFSDFK